MPIKQTTRKTPSLYIRVRNEDFLDTGCRSALGAGLVDGTADVAIVPANHNYDPASRKPQEFECHVTANEAHVLLCSGGTYTQCAEHLINLIAELSA